MKKQFGFTLIELLIVVALLGVLAMGLIAAIDPVEQIRRGRDTALRDIAAQFYQAEQRYYTNRGAFTAGVIATPVGGSLLSTLNADITTLLAAGEVKTNFQNSVNAGTPARGTLVTVSTLQNDTELIVCFDPESKSFTTAPENICDANGLNCAGAASNTRWTCIR